MLASLLLVVLVGIACVLWFMNEAMRNERMAVRERLAQAYQGQLTLVQQQTQERWNRWRAQLDAPEPDAAHFARVVQGGLADSIICFDAEGHVAYPRISAYAKQDRAAKGDALQADLRARVKAGDVEGAVQFVLDSFANENGAAIDSHGRLVAPSAELLALELLKGKGDARFDTIASRLRARVLDYQPGVFPSSQRVFVMREFERLVPGTAFPTLAAEELAARFLDEQKSRAREEQLQQTELRDIWSVATPSRRVLALLSTASLRARLAAMTGLPGLPASAKVTVTAPDERMNAAETIATSEISPLLPGWHLALTLQDRGQFDLAADERVRRYLLIGSVVVAAMIVLAVLAGRKLGSHMQLARLKNDLVANVSHELKTPLTSMRALVDTLLDSEELNEAHTREYLQLMAVENARLSRVIDNFLTFSRLERNKFTFTFTPLHPAAIVEGAVAALGSRARAPECKLSVHVAPDLPKIEGDSDALVTALLNLLDNAWKYTGGTKEITVRVEAVGDAVHFAVQDNGAGLSAAEIRQVFDRFHQADNRLTRTASGCGLGLSIVRSIVAAHRGDARVDSIPGQGSTFTIVIPAILGRPAL
jgi:signal transduction histidine kinase